MAMLGQQVKGAVSNMPSFKSADTMTANTSEGYARITYISN
jgi:hypothetical protein